MRKTRLLIARILLDILNNHPPHWTRVVGCGPFSLCVIHKNYIIYLTTDWRNGPNGASDRGFDSRTVQTFVCMNMSIYIGSRRFLCIVCMYLQKNNFKYVYLSVI
jgi:hypothetical protein